MCCCYFISIFRIRLELFEVLSLSDLMYKYFCKLSLGLKFWEFYFGFTGYNMPMIKASQIWNKVSRAPLVILVKLVSPRCLKQLIVQFKVLNINCYSFSHLFYTPLVILVKLVSPRCLKQLIKQFKVLNIHCDSFSHLFYTQSEQLNIQITHSHRYNSADLQIANKIIIEAFKTL